MSSTYGGADNFPALITLIGDTDPPNAGNFNPAPEGLADRTVYLKNRTGTDRFVAHPNAYDVVVDDTGATVQASWTDVSITPANSFTLTTIPNPNAAVGDILDVALYGAMALGPVAAATVVRGFLYLTVKVGGGAWARIPGAMAMLNGTAVASGVQPLWAPFTMRTKYVAASTATTLFGVAGIIQAGATIIEMVGSYSALVAQTRANP